MVPFRRSPRTRSGRHSEALNTAGSLLTENRVPFARDGLRLRLAGFLVLLISGPALLSGPADLSPKVNDLIDRFFSMPEFENLRLSPDGAHVSLEKKLNGQMALATLDLKTGHPAVTAPAYGQYVANSFWVGPDQLMFELIEDHSSVNSRDVAGAATMLHVTSREKYYRGHWLVDGEITKMEEVPTLEHVLVLVDALPQDPTRVLLAEQSSDKFYSSLYCYDPSRNKTKLLERNPGRILEWKTDAAGRVRLAVVAEKGGGHSYLYRETEQSEWHPVPFPDKADFITFDPTGRYVLISFPDKSGRLVMQSYDLVSRQLTDQPEADPVYDIDPVAIRDPRTGVARALIYSAAKISFIWLDPAFQALQKRLAPTFPDAVVYPVGPTQAGDVLVLTYSDVSPRQYFMLDLQHNRLRTFLDQQPKVRGLTLSPMKPVTFKATDGTALYGYLTMPAGNTSAKPPPLIAISHGGPFLRDHWEFDPEVQYFASLGYAVLQVNYRGSTGYGTGYALQNIIQVGRKSVDDVADGVRWATAEGHADPKRVVVYGGSYGGYISLGIATRHPELASCVVGFAGVYDWELEMKSDSDKLRDWVSWKSDYLPDWKTNAARYHEISPVERAEKVKAPVLLLHGRDDRRVEVGQSELMARALRKAGKAVELVRDAEGVHGLPDENLRRAYYERVTAFILKYAPPDVLP